jgi:hypothetical protein
MGTLRTFAVRATYGLALAIGGTTAFLPAAPAAAQAFSFSTGSPDGKIATASRPNSGGGVFEIESADDFTLTVPTSITSATFTGLLPENFQGSIGQVVVEIYRVFPKDSDTSRTPNVPTRTNSPSDVAFDERDSSAGSLSFMDTVLQATFPANNSVQPGGIDLGTHGDGPVTGEEVEFSVNFTQPFLLPADHYFFVPQVELSSGNFLWLSAPKTIPAPADLQSWTRDQALDPDWLRVGTDIVDGAAPVPQFNAAFSLAGTAGVPEPSTWAMMLIGFAGLVFAGRRARGALRLAA